ncbi:MAG: class A beta-lactamase-related serine hydrolase [Candidatus Heimdallarchaeota archaeon]|nr:class A beta-lactamase-related serine hydrolase [Candidatus Heimdallarchaeota archaeon]
MTEINGIIGKLRAEIEKTIEEKNIVGLAISLLDDKNILWNECFGYTDLESKNKVNLDTTFSIQSIGKVFTAVAIMRGATKGIISLDSKLVDYYPDFTINSKYGKPQIDKITIRHLLAHFAGFTHRSKVGGEYDLSEPTFEEYIKSIPDTWLRYPIGERFLYSNLGMALAAYSLQKTSDMNFTKFVQEEICSPLGITTLAYGKKVSEKNPNRAIGYHFGCEAEYSNLVFYGAGGQFVSTNDMSRFVQFLLNEGKINGRTHIKKELLDEMAKEQFSVKGSKKYYGLGLFVDKELFDGIELRYHSGSGCGYGAFIGWNLDYKIGVVILSNNDQAQDVVKIGKEAINSLLILKGAEIAPPQEITPSTFITKPRISVNLDTLKKLEGLYAITGGRFEFRITDNKPLAIYQGQSIQLHSHSETEFTADIPLAIKFILEEDKPFAADVLMNGVIHRLLYQKTKEEEVFGANKKNWKQLEGIYQTMYLGDPVYFAIKVDNGHLKVYLENKAEILFEYKDNIFFTNDERAVIFHDNFLYFDNIKMDKLDDPVTPIKEHLVKNPKHRFLTKWKLKELYFNLVYLEKNEEADEIKEIFFQLYPEEKKQ